MRFEDSHLSKTLSFTIITTEFCKNYMFEDFFIMEVDEGIHFNIEKFNLLLTIIRDHFGVHKRIAFISNRINSYSIDPVLWSYFDKDDSYLIAAAIVSYRESTFLSANIEKQLASIPIKRSKNLEEAIDWIRDLRELN